ncbi:glutathione S-transferase family protein [Pseudoalteromonas sp. SR44-5]|uniref:glutathione S-transferase family protein n=1 Tax=unclassified Pseudoalteromonas TaxID=194690 RepID=UPI0015FFBC8B|nr:MULTISPECIES: glutathione S-transferase family protein [unclassified Pseudoalteromonas]MBB1333346.1 glutathione S-transferase family protein [Pseudoalteromonas sp. SR41-6]MBB1341288.1 glutathione S-transferase family protein [Pseudoalteromonas sp. SR45-6]MBB1366491.1 glutathione S-transferase family protein [Pseudoalteromonas sp. SR44-5]MBB1417200.1 glutathione S-transferase family protein [Pseudoalteromonas sp. SG44-1]MBB1423548.1 glutathione S-transferase family protein [Pseudoalteromonas
MQLLGSTTSPFVRRIRIWALLNQCSLEFINLDIFSDTDRQLMIQNNPARKIPVLITKQQTLADSNNIIRFLLEQHSQTRLNWQQEHLLTIINACNDSLVELLLCQRSGFDTQDDKLFFNLQNERIAETLSYLNNHFADAGFKSCEYLCISLYCLLDWICFRELTDLTAHTELMKFYYSFAQQQAVQQTDPRN